MELKEFQQQAIKTESVINNVQVNLQYISAILQILIGAGNLLDQVKKNVFYGKPFNVTERANHIKDIIEAMDSKALFVDDPEQDKVIMKTNTRLFHAIIGISTESTELLENLIDGENIDVVNMLEEFSDLDWYKAIGCDEVNADWEQMLETIISKLQKRYPDKFNADHAINRNLTSERTILETMDYEPQNNTI